MLETLSPTLRMSGHKYCRTAHQGTCPTNASQPQHAILHDEFDCKTQSHEASTKTDDVRTWRMHPHGQCHRRTIQSWHWDLLTTNRFPLSDHLSRWRVNIQANPTCLRLLFYSKRQEKAGELTFSRQSWYFFFGFSSSFRKKVVTLHALLAHLEDSKQ